MKFPNKLREIRDAKGVSAYEIAKRIGVPHQQIYRLENGERKLSREWAMKIAPVLEIAPQDLLFETHPTPSLPPIARAVPVVGKVAGGNWREQSVIEADSDGGEDIFAVVPRGVPADAIYALKVEGTSVNKVAGDGDYAVCIDIWRAPRAAQDGDWVVVKRSKQDGTAETTVKKFKISGGTYELHPESTDPRHQSILSLEGDDVASVEIIALVLSFIKIGVRL